MAFYEVEFHKVFLPIIIWLSLVYNLKYSIQLKYKVMFYKMNLILPLYSSLITRLFPFFKFN